MSKHEIKKFHSKQDTTYVLDNGSTLHVCQLNPPIDFFSKMDVTYFYTELSRKKTTKNDTSSRKMIPHCHLLADYRKLIPGAANIDSL